MAIKLAILVILLAISVAGDILHYKIYNIPVGAGLAAGLILNFMLSGFIGVAQSLLSAIFPVMTLFVLFALRMLGAGDIKLLSAIGAIMGFRFILYTIVSSFLAGGAMAVIIMLVRGNARSRFRYIVIYLKSVFLTKVLTPYTDFCNEGDGAKFHFSLAIAAGCCVQIVMSLLPGILYHDFYEIMI